MSHTYRVPAEAGFEANPESNIVLSAKLFRKGKEVKGVAPKIDGLSVTCSSPMVNPGDEIEVVVGRPEEADGDSKEGPSIPEKVVDAVKKAVGGGGE